MGFSNEQIQRVMKSADVPHSLNCCLFYALVHLDPRELPIGMSDKTENEVKSE
jgi:hypothetical protein